MVKETVIENWANALYDIAKENNKVLLYLEQTTVIINLLKQYPEYLKIISNSNILKEKRKTVIDETFKNNFEVHIVNTLKLLIDRNYISSTRYIFKEVRKLLNMANSVQYGTVFSVLPLTKSQLERIKDKISKKLNQEVELVNKIDPSLIGGIKIKVKNQIIDGSLQGRKNAIFEKALTNK